MNKNNFISLLSEMTLLLELKGANPFKIRALNNAARTLKGISGDLNELLISGELRSVKGIGKGIINLIAEVNQTGESSELEQLRKEIPAGLVEMGRIPGMGPKKIKTVWEKLSVTTIGELEYACRENRLRDLEGFGTKTQEKILSGIEFLRKHAEHFLLSEAEKQSVEIAASLNKIDGVIRCEISGSLRRKMEYVDKIELILEISPEKLLQIREEIQHLPGVEEIISEGNQKMVLRLNSGIKTEIYFSDRQSFPFLLRFVSGSAKHNQEITRWAEKINFTLTDLELRNAKSEKIECDSEETIFNQLKLQFIEPELREGLGEIEFAAKHQLPHLVEPENIQGIIHAHSTYSDGTNSLEEMAHACQSKGYRYLVISDHSKTAFYAHGLTEERILQQHKEIEALNRKFKGFRILKSIESDILPDGTLDYPEEILATFDLIIASVHSKFNMTEAEATARVMKAIENPFTSILGHPTGRLLLTRDGYPLNMHKIIETASRLGIAIELNANPHRLDADWRLLREAKERGVKISLGPDAHRVEGIDDIRYGISMARKGWLTRQDILNCLTADELLSFAKRRRQ